MPLGFPYYLSGLGGEGLLRLHSIVPPPPPPELLSPSTIKLENVGGLFVSFSAFVPSEFSQFYSLLLGCRQCGHNSMSISSAPLEACHCCIKW